MYMKARHTSNTDILHSHIHAYVIPQREKKNIYVYENNRWSERELATLRIQCEEKSPIND